MAWQMSNNRQDDAVDYGVALHVIRDSGVVYELDYRGYAGWRGGDKPMVLAAAAEVPLLRSVAVRGSFGYGITDDAPPYEVRLGFVFRFDTPMRARER